MKEGFGGERRPKDRVTLQIILVFTLTLPKTFTQGRVSVHDKYLHWPSVRCNFFGNVSVKWFTLTLDLDTVYTIVDTYTHNTGCNPSPKKTSQTCLPIEML